MTNAERDTLDGGREMAGRTRLALASTFHDPGSRLASLVERSARTLQGLFSEICVCVTPETHSGSVEMVKAGGFRVEKGSTERITTYKRAIEGALTSGPDCLFCCDFDRVLHWVSRYPEELAKTCGEVVKHDFTIIGRTDRAFATHPETQKETESIINAVCSYALGSDSRMDVISATWAGLPRIVRYILDNSSGDDFGLYAEWPILGFQKASNPAYLEAEGLEWETPDRYEEEITAMGYDGWIEAFQSPEEWRHRVAIARRAVEAFLKSKAMLARSSDGS